MEKEIVRINPEQIMKVEIIDKILTEGYIWHDEKTIERDELVTEFKTYLWLFKVETYKKQKKTVDLPAGFYMKYSGWMKTEDDIIKKGEYIIIGKDVYYKPKIVVYYKNGTHDVFKYDKFEDAFNDANFLFESMPFISIKRGNK